MKNIYLYFLLFIAITAQSQIVNIPDANFKAKLLQADTTNSIASSNSAYFSPMKVDTNSNGQIEVSEALLVKMLDVNNAGISSLTGIDSFSNLRWLFCNYNSLTSLDVNSLTLLRRLDCSHNVLSSLNCQNIENKMEILNCSYNNLTFLILPNFYEFEDQGDQDMYANCSHNQLNTIILQDNEQFSYLNLSYNNLTTLSFNNLEIYGVLILSNNPLTDVNLDTTYVGSQTPDYANGNFICDYTNVTQLDIPFNVTDSRISHNPNLVNLNIRNNKIDFDYYYEVDENGEETGNIIYYGVDISSNPLLASICVDADEFGYYTGTVPSTIQVTQNCALAASMSEKNMFKLYPNPSSEIVNIEISNNQIINNVAVSNILGQTIMAFGNTTMVDITQLSKGTYFITVITDKGKNTQRIIKL